MSFDPEFKPTKMASLPTAVLDGSKDKRTDDEIRELIRRYNVMVDAYYELTKYIIDKNL